MFCTRSVSHHNFFFFVFACAVLPHFPDAFSLAHRTILLLFVFHWNHSFVRFHCCYRCDASIRANHTLNALIEHVNTLVSTLLVLLKPDVVQQCNVKFQSNSDRFSPFARERFFLHSLKILVFFDWFISYQIYWTFWQATSFLGVNFDWRKAQIYVDLMPKHNFHALFSLSRFFYDEMVSRKLKSWAWNTTSIHFTFVTKTNCYNL